jgi:protein-tyrosine-phosphatase, low molecular weight
VGMDEMNIRNMKRVYHNDPEGKIHLLLEYTDNCRSISDPWYSGDFDTACHEIEQGCIALFKHLTSEKS